MRSLVETSTSIVHACLFSWKSVVYATIGVPAHRSKVVFRLLPTRVGPTNDTAAGPSNSTYMPGRRSHKQLSSSATKTACCIVTSPETSRTPRPHRLDTGHAMTPRIPPRAQRRLEEPRRPARREALWSASVLAAGAVGHVSTTIDRSMSGPKHTSPRKGSWSAASGGMRQRTGCQRRSLECSPPLGGSVLDRTDSSSQAVYGRRRPFLLVGWSWLPVQRTHTTPEVTLEDSPHTRASRRAHPQMELAHSRPFVLLR